MRRLMALACVGSLPACGDDTVSTITPQKSRRAAALCGTGKRKNPSTLVTKINNRTGKAAANTALVVNGSQAR